MILLGSTFFTNAIEISTHGKDVLAHGILFAPCNFAAPDFLGGMLVLASGGLTYLVFRRCGKLRAIYPTIGGSLPGVRFGGGPGRSLVGGAKRRQR